MINIQTTISSKDIRPEVFCCIILANSNLFTLPLLSESAALKKPSNCLRFSAESTMFTKLVLGKLTSASFILHAYICGMPNTPQNRPRRHGKWTQAERVQTKIAVEICSTRTASYCGICWHTKGKEKKPVCWVRYVLLLDFSRQLLYNNILIF